MKILMLSWRGPRHPKAGGAEVYTSELLTELVATGHKVTWYSAYHKRAPSGAWRGITLLYGLPSLWVYLSGFFYGKKCHSQYDLVIDQINTFGFCSPLFHGKKITLIHQLADTIWDEELPWPLNKIGRRLEKCLLSLYRTQPFITVSESTAKDLAEIGWSGPHCIVRNGLRSPLTSEGKAGTPVLCFLGRFSQRSKRLKDAVVIFDLVRQSIPDVELWVIGRGVIPPQYLNKQGLYFYPNVGDLERDKLLQKAWLCIATSVREGWGRMVAEAAIAGTPAVVYDVPGLRDVVKAGYSGLVVPPNPEAAANAVLSMLSDRALLTEYSRNAYERSLRWTWENETRLMVQFVCDVL